MGILRSRFGLITASITVSFAFLLGVSELGIRLFVNNGDVTPEILRDRSVQYDPAVFARHVFKQEERTITHASGSKKGVVWEINEKGYRGPNFEMEKPEGVIRIIVYGGSAAFDMMVSEGKDWPHLVQENLGKSGLANIEVINAGIMGHTALESVGRLFAEGFVFKPDFVLIYNAWNDIKYLTSKKTVLRTLRPWSAQFDPRIHYRNMLDRWLCERSQLYTVLRRIYYKNSLKIGKEGLFKVKDRPLSLSELNPTGFRQYQLALEMFVDLARNMGAMPLLMTQARLVDADNTSSQRERIDYHHVGMSHEALVGSFDRFDSIVRKVAAEKQALLIDASAHLSGKDWAFYDHVHLDLAGKGSEVMAKFVAEGLQNVLRKKLASNHPSTLER
jgi:lysophospholipase L1-like esterase